MMKLKVVTPFVGHGYNMPDAGSLISAEDPLADHLIDIGVCVPFEAEKAVEKPVVKVEKPVAKEPVEKKSSASLPAAPVLPKKTAKRSKKTAKK